MSKKYFRLTVIFIAFTFLAVVAAPWGVGHFLHKVLADKVEQFNEANAQFGVSLKLKDYQNNFYSSFVSIDLIQKPVTICEAKLEKESPAIIHTIFKGSIQHGPIILDIQAKKIDFVLAKVKSQIMFPETSVFKIAQKSLIISSIVNYLGKQTASVLIEKVSGSSIIKNGNLNNIPKENIFFESNGIKINFSCYLKEPFFTYDLKIKDFQIKTEKLNLKLNGIMIKGNVGALTFSNLNHNSKVSPDKIKPQEPQSPINNANFKLDSNYVIVNHSCAAEIDFQEVVANGIAYGPGELNYTIDGISDKFIQECLNLKQNKSHETITHAIKNLAQVNNLSLNLSLKTCNWDLPDGKSSLKAALFFKGDEERKRIDSNGKLGVKVSKKIAFNLANNIKGSNYESNEFFGDKSFFIDTGEQYESYLLYKNGEIYRNGVPDSEPSQFMQDVFIDSYKSFKRPFSTDKKLLVAIWLDDVETVNNLIKAGIILNSLNSDVRNPLPVAAFMDNYGIIGLLLENKAPVNQIDYFGNTALLLATRRGNIQIVKCLLAHGAEPDVCNVRGWTPLQEAAEMGHLALVKLLLQQKVNINKADTENRTALFWAAKNGHDEIVQLLLNKGADPAIADISGTTPRDIAKTNKHISVVIILGNSY